MSVFTTQQLEEGFFLIYKKQQKNKKRFLHIRIRPLRMSTHTLLSIMMFWGLISRCRTFFACRYATARMSCWKILALTYSLSLWYARGARHTMSGALASPERVCFCTYEQTIAERPCAPSDVGRASRLERTQSARSRFANCIPKRGTGEKLL